MILGGVYLLALIGTPLILSQNINPKDNHTTQLITKTENKITENRLYIPKIDINLPYSTGGAETMEHGACGVNQKTATQKMAAILSYLRTVLSWA